MSQVRKLLKGQNIPKYKYGHLIIDGIDYGNSEDVYKQFAEHAKLQNPSQGASYDAWLRQLQNGEDVVLGVNNSSNVRPDNVSENRAGQRTFLEKVVDDVFNTSRNNFSDATYTARQFVPIKSPKQKKLISNDSASFVFTGEEPKYSEGDMNNSALADRFDDYLNWLSDDLWEEDNQFSSKLSDSQKAGLRAWYSRLNGNNPYEVRQAAKEEWNKYLDRVKATEGGWDNVDDETKNFFANFNIGTPTQSSSTSGSASSASASEKDLRKKLKKAGYSEDLYKLLGDNFDIDSDGTIVSKSGSFDFGLGPGNFYFNNDFYNTAFGAEGKYDPLRGLTYYNGSLYRNNSARLAAILNAEDSYNERYKRGDFNGADQIIRTRWSRSDQENPMTIEQDDYSTFVKPGMQFSNLTGLVTLNDGSLQNGQQIIQYIDPNSLTQDGSYAQYNYKFALLDDRGNWLRDLSKEDLQNIANGTSAGKLNTYKKTPFGQGAYANKYYEDIMGSNGSPSGIRIYRDIKNPNEDVILHIDGLNGAAKGKDVRLPKEVAKILMQDQSWVKKIVGNSQARMNFAKALESLVQDRSWRRIRDVLGATGIMGPYNLIFNGSGGDRDYDSSRLKALGLAKEQSKALQEALRNATTGNKWDRREQYLLDTPEFKNGGKVQYISKLAKGGFAGGSMGSNGVTEKRVDTKVRDPRNASGLSDIGSENWTQADTKDLLSLVGDAGSLALAFTPGANLASTGVGVASSLARYSADKDRGTSGAGWQLALNLGMDAATALPFLGGVVKTGKIARAIKAATPLLQKAARVIITSASAYGLGSAVVTSASKIANGEKFTVMDISNVVNGITAGVGIAKSGGLGKQSKTTKTEVFKEQKFKVGNTDVKLNSDELGDIAKAPDQAKALRAMIKTKAEGESQSAIAAAAEKLLKSKQNLWQRVSKKDGELVLNVPKENQSNTSTVESNGNWLHDWWYRTGKYSQLYNAKLVNEGVGKTPTKKDYIKNLGKKKLSSKEALKSDSKGKPIFEKGEPVQTGYYSAWYNGPEGPEGPRIGERYVIPYIAQTQQLNRRRIDGRTFDRRGFNRAVAHHNNLQNYYNRIAVARPNIILPLQLSGYSYDELPGTYRYPFYKKGGVLKAQNGLSPTTKRLIENAQNIFDNQKLKDFKFNDNYNYDPEIDQQFINDQSNLALISLLEDSNLPDAHKKRYISDLRSSISSESTPKTIYGDFNIDTSRALASLFKTGLGAAEYGVNAIGRQRVRDIMAKGINESIPAFHNIIYNHIDQRTPEIERAIGQANAEAAVDNTPKSRDLTQHLIALNNQQHNRNQLISNLVGQQSAQTAKYRMANAEVDQRQALDDRDVADKQDAAIKGARMEEAQNDASLELQDYMSKVNALRELRANTESELQKANQFAFNQESQALDDLYDRNWNARLGDKYSEWQNLSSDVRDKYEDVNDWLQRAESNKGLWANYEDAWNAHQKALNDKRIALYRKYNLSPMAQVLSRQRYGVMKKGGRVGRNRYKNEPEEDVWINQNKAVHKQVAKLNDNIIKIFLKTLK